MTTTSQTAGCEPLTRGNAEPVASSERRLRALIEKSGEGILLLDDQGATTYASPVAARLLGVTMDEVPAAIRDRIVHPDDRQRVSAADQALRAQPGASVESEFRVAHPDGTWHWIETTRTNLLDDPAVGAIVCNFRDVTERKRLTDQLVHAQKMEALACLAGGVAHDFNNMLSAILIHTELCTQGLHDPRQLREDLAVIREVCLGATTLTRQLLAFTHKQVMQPRDMALNGFVAEVTKMLRRMVGEDIELETRLAPDLGTVRCDPTHLTQVVLNLVVNAREAMPSGGRLVIGTANAELDGAAASALGEGLEPGPYVELWVADTGVGMDEATMSRIFDPAFSTKPRGRGTGLGLSTVFAIAKDSGGAVAVDSRPGGGSTFRIYLPCVAAGITVDDRLGATGVRRAGCSVLLAEDDAPARRALTRLLEQQGFQVRAAAGLAEAIAVLDESPVDVLVTDMIMRDGDGATLATMARTRQPGIRVLFMSGYTDRDILEKQLTGPESAFLPKPFTAEQLESALHALAA